ncbi:alpha/beta hydrolase [Roseibacterium elongatum DSM 19469]|uniref:Alpha/beta hydrolase n=1 Tax=Roseicyclus elongatus DSM 19469 TaxID=1294273 RepID=W8RQS6_9RHOB|nr:alpha/beta fold hydrolase BchO [Roseibacterium elongatum]AHM03509.1 alpha/beta hydrolase [Roseibacterium elongatum DSM 19469]
MTAPIPPEDWPHRGASRIVPVSPHRWHIQTFGTGEDVLFLHGAGASAHSWHRLVPFLDHRFHMIVPDLPGHGFTRSPRGRSRLSDVARDLGALLTDLGANPRMIVGHSAGGAIALEMARQGVAAPERVVVVNGALENFRGPAGWLFPMMARVMALNPLTGFLLSSGSPSQVRGLIGATGTELDDEALAVYQRLIKRKAHVDGTMAMMAQWSLNDLNRALGDIEVPTLFLHGDQDQAVSVAVAERAAGLMPNATLRVLNDVGHIAQEEAPEAVADAIDQFLARPATV